MPTMHVLLLTGSLNADLKVKERKEEMLRFICCDFNSSLQLMTGDAMPATRVHLFIDSSNTDLLAEERNS